MTGPPAAFADFSALPALLALARGAGGPDAAMGRWAEHLEDAGAGLDHVEDGPAAVSDTPHRLLAEDAWGVCQWTGLLGRDGSPSGAALRAVEASSPEAALASLLADRVRDVWRVGAGRVEVVPLLLRAARRMAESAGPLASGLLLCEMALLAAAARRGADQADLAIGRIEAHRGEADAATSEGDVSQIERRRTFADAMRERCLPDEAALPGGPPPTGLTQARSTAMLLTFCGLFDMVLPHGPAQLLAPPQPPLQPLFKEGRAPVLTKGGHLWNPGLDAWEVEDLLFALLDHGVPTSDAFTYRQLDVDMATRRAAGGGDPGAQTTVKQWRIYNKAVSMELLTSDLLARLDHAEAVHAQLSTRLGHPYRAAGQGDSDIEVEYPNVAGRRLSLVAEVSAKRKIGTGGFRAQLEQALSHAERLQAERGGTVYALVATDGEIGSDANLQKAFRQFVAKSRLNPNGPVRLVPVFALDLAAAFGDLASQEEGAGLAFSAKSLAATLDHLLRGLLNGTPPEDDWMREALAAAPGLDHQMLGDDDPPGAPGSAAPRGRRRPSGPP